MTNLEHNLRSTNLRTIARILFKMVMEQLLLQVG